MSLLHFWLTVFSGLGISHMETGRLSMYHPGDGHCGKQTACGNSFTMKSHHIAHRRWYRLGCGREVIVCADDTEKCVATTVQDGGPYGIYFGKMRHAVKEGRWKVWTKARPPKGWKWRAIVDLSWALWVDLGKPRALSRVQLYFLVQPQE